MSAADHPSIRGRLCASPGCDEPGIAHVTWPQTTAVNPAKALAIVRPLVNPNPIGVLLCVGCVHAAVDVMLMRCMPERAR